MLKELPLALLLLVLLLLVVVVVLVLLLLLLLVLAPVPEVEAELAPRSAEAETKEGPDPPDAFVLRPRLRFGLDMKVAATSLLSRYEVVPVVMVSPISRMHVPVPMSHNRRLRLSEPVMCGRPVRS